MVRVTEGVSLCVCGGGGGSPRDLRKYTAGDNGCLTVWVGSLLETSESILLETMGVSLCGWVGGWAAS